MIVTDDMNDRVLAYLAEEEAAVPVPSVHCEARKVSYRQTKEGLVVAFVIHPNDMPDALAVAPLGQRYMLALAAIGDDEQPLEPASPPSATPAAERPGVEPSSPTARARASQFARERYQEASPMVQARTRASLLAKDERFQAWVATQFGIGAVPNVEGAAAYIRAHCCDGASRADIAVDPEAYRKFLALETMFKIAVGEIAEPR